MSAGLMAKAPIYRGWLKNPINNQQSKREKQMAIQRAAQHSIQSTNIADLLERVLDKGIVIAGDIKISLVDIELLTIQLRLVICSVDKAKEMGMDWWVNNPVFSRQAPQRAQVEDTIVRIEKRLQKLESSSAEASGRGKQI